MSDTPASSATQPAAAPGLGRFAPLIVFVLVLAGAVWALQRGGARLEWDSQMVGQAAPAYALADLNAGPAITPETFAGKPYLINFFAENCPGCRIEHPLLEALNQQAVPILGVVYKDEPEDVRRFLAELGDPFVRVGLEGQASRFALELGVAGTPETFVIGADGTIKAMHRGALTPDVLEGVILPALGLPN
jgi:cytochrome c biogenesis protein CcmG, thiol:disulfide interchange protein DsbE